MWKLLLSQSTEGFWNASSTTAFALEARDPLETANLKPTLLEKLKQALSSAAEEVEDEHGDVTEAAMQALQGAGRNDEPEVEDAAQPATSAAAHPKADAVHDDPLTCSASAIVASVPVRLAALRLADPSIDVVRVWTTLCCVAHLQRLNVSWIWGDGDICAWPFVRAGCHAAVLLPDAHAACFRLQTRSASAPSWTPAARGWRRTLRSGPR